MPDRLLDANGTVTEIPDNYFSDAEELMGDADSSQLTDDIRHATTIVVSFPSSADGRGFSVAAQFREDASFTGKIFASGKLNPDQLSLAFQCGFDGIVVDDAQWDHYGEASWTQALKPLVNHTYVRTHWRQMAPIWERRATPPEA